MRDITAIGSTTRDGFLKVNLPIIDWPKTPLGKAFILPLGEKLYVEDVYFTLGGNAANASVTFARQGFKTALFTKIGKDLASEGILRILKQERVDARLIKKSNLPTAYSVLLLQGGERTILNYHGAIEKFSLKDVNPKELKSRWWYISLPGESYKLFGWLLKVAKKNGISVALNPNSHHIIAGRRELIKHLKDINFLVLNEGEAAALTGIPFSKEKAVFKRLDALVPGIVAVTSGKKGVVVSDGRFIYRAGTFKEKKLVDRTGAGDAFGSGFVAGLMKKKEKCTKGLCNPHNIEYAMKLASANATSVVEHIGATEGILKIQEFEKSNRFKNLKIFYRSL
ncbi:MAG: carbohydrate kinase family protein [Candidatus Colwellbacteria bacterium]|nr:carbohydrate kinase family protein [Candidatus Colwellbacteria bacterium]